MSASRRTSAQVLVDREELSEEIERQIPTILQRLLVVMSQVENEQLAVARRFADHRIKET